MSRFTLLVLQILVGVVAIALWHVLTTVPIGGVMLLPPFFFSTPLDVASRVVKWFVEGTIWRHLWITLVEALLAFVIGSVAGVLIGFWFARQPLVAAVFDPYVKQSAGVRAFIDAILAGCPASPGFADGVRVQRVLEAVKVSGKEGRVVGIS